MVYIILSLIIAAYLWGALLLYLAIFSRVAFNGFKNASDLYKLVPKILAWPLAVLSTKGRKTLFGIVKRSQQ